jgi:ribosomal protein S18 acetylase RimI-like enzyme
MPPFTVSPVAAHELLPACRLLFADGRAEQCRDRLLAGEPASGLFVARNSEGRLCAAVLVQALPGALGVALPPRGDPDDARNDVTATACQWLRERGTKVCQAFVTADDAADLAPLEQHGFRHVTQLATLRRAVGSPFDTPAPPVRWRPWAAEPTREQLELLLATHQDTLDCPELNHARTGEEIIAGFRSGPDARCAWWSASDETDRLIGVVQFDGAAGDGLEVSYLGLVPAARGRGLAGALIRFADRVASTGGYRTLNVSVDVRNAPAMKLYTRHGFIEYDRRAVWLAAWPQ